MHTLPSRFPSRLPLRPFLTVAALVAAVLGAHVAAADDPGPSAATTRAYQRLLVRFDANHDRVLQVSELPEHVRARLGRADTDGDGRISIAELHAYGVARRAERFARADRNGDGKLGPSEVGAARWEHLKVADADGDGAVTLDEIERAIAADRLRGPEDEDHGDP